MLFVDHDVVWISNFEIAPKHLCRNPKHQETGSADTGEHAKPEVPVNP